MKRRVGVRCGTQAWNGRYAAQSRTKWANYRSIGKDLRLIVSVPSWFYSAFSVGLEARVIGMAEMLLGMVGLVAAFFSPGAFAALILGATGLLAFNAHRLMKTAPRPQLGELSTRAQLLLDLFPWAWSFPGVTRLIGTASTVLLICALVRGVVCAFKQEWAYVAVAVASIAGAGWVSGRVFPTAYIRREGLEDANDEIMRAMLSAHVRKDARSTAAPT